MFTGIITAVGKVSARAQRDGGLELTIDSPYPDLGLGESVAVDGACLTVQQQAGGSFTSHIIRTSLERTSFNTYDVGRKVNLERALQVGDRLGGHLVQGHVDGVGEVTAMDVADANAVLRVRVPAALARYLVEKGSVVLDGVSLTVTDIGKNEFGVALVPYTLEATTLGALRPGDPVNVEVDLVAKYVERFIGWDNDKRKDGSR